MSCKHLFDRPAAGALVACALLGIAGCTNDRAAGSPTSMTAPAPSASAPMDNGTVAPLPILFVGRPTADPPVSVETSFAMNEVGDLYIYIAWPGIVGDHAMEVRLFGPSGRLFRSLTLPVNLQTGIPISDGVGAWAKLPIGGTAITAHGMFGNWRVEARLDDGSRAEGRFALE